MELRESALMKIVICIFTYHVLNSVSFSLKSTKNKKLFFAKII